MVASIKLHITDTKKNAKPSSLEADFTGNKTFNDMVDTVKTFHLAVARASLLEEQKNGFEKNPRIRVDNKFDRDERVVIPFGKIEYFARGDVGLAILEIYAELDRRSPVVTGKFKRGNILFYNGQIVADSLSAANAFVSKRNKGDGFQSNDQFTFINVNPYARKLEYLGSRRGTRGKQKGRNVTAGSRKGKNRKTGIKLKKPNGTYYLTYRLARRRFKQIANFIKFQFVPNGTNGINIQALSGERTTFSPRNKKSKRGLARAGRPYLYPTISINLSGKGITGGVAYE